MYAKVPINRYFRSPIIINECQCLNIASSMFERSIPLRLQKVASTKCRKNRGVEKLSKGGYLKKGEVNFERGGFQPPRKLWVTS